MSFHLVYNLLLLQFLGGFHISPGLQMIKA